MAAAASRLTLKVRMAPPALEVAAVRPGADRPVWIPEHFACRRKNGVLTRKSGTASHQLNAFV